MKAFKNTENGYLEDNERSLLFYDERNAVILNGVFLSAFNIENDQEPFHPEVCWNSVFQEIIGIF